MEDSLTNGGRREFLIQGISVALVVAAGDTRLRAADTSVLDVAYAGSMGSMMEGPIKSGAAATLRLEMHGRAQGSSALAQLIVGGSIRPDVFIPITPRPALTVLRAGKAESAQPVAQTEMVIAYSPQSRFAPDFDAASKGKADWWKVLQQPGLRFGRTDPVTDPQGRNIIFTVMLASKTYNQADLLTKILRLTINRSFRSRLSRRGCRAANWMRHRPTRFSPGRSNCRTSLCPGRLI